MITSTVTAAMTASMITITTPAITPPDTPDGGGSTEGVELGMPAVEIHSSHEFPC